MKHGYSVIISSADSQNSKNFFLGKWKIRFILLILFVVIFLIVYAAFNYSSLYYRSLRFGTMKQKYEEVEKEFAKLTEIEKNLAVAEHNDKKIRVMLGVEKNPPLVKAKITEMNSKYTIQHQIYPENKNIPSLSPTIGEISKGFRPGHNGIDIAAPQYSPVVAAATGIIKETGWDSIFGNYLVIEHNENYSTFYGHLNSINGKMGKKVNCGEVIGTVGSSGKSTSPHLHYEIRFQGKSVDPIGYLPYFAHR